MSVRRVSSPSPCVQSALVALPRTGLARGVTYTFAGGAFASAAFFGFLGRPGFRFFLKKLFIEACLPGNEDFPKATGGMMAISK